jgi:hypothetical protein
MLQEQDKEPGDHSADMPSHFKASAYSITGVSPDTSIDSMSAFTERIEHQKMLAGV